MGCCCCGAAAVPSGLRLVHDGGRCGAWTVAPAVLLLEVGAAARLASTRWRRVRPLAHRHCFSACCFVLRLSCIRFWPRHPSVTDLSVPAHPLSSLPSGGGRKKLKRREREALLQQHGIALAGQLKGQAGGEPQARSGPAANGSSGPASQEGDAAAAAAAAEGAPPPPPADDDDDIFGDVGTDYVPTIKDKERMQQKAAAAAEAARRGGYFGGGEDLHADLPPLPKEGGWGSGSLGV